MTHSDALEKLKDAVLLRHFPHEPFPHGKFSANAANEHQRCENKPAQGNALGKIGRTGQPCRGDTNRGARFCPAPSGLPRCSVLFPGRRPGLACRRAFGPHPCRSASRRASVGLRGALRRGWDFPVSEGRFGGAGRGRGSRSDSRRRATTRWTPSRCPRRTRRRCGPLRCNTATRAPPSARSASRWSWRCAGCDTLSESRLSGSTRRLQVRAPGASAPSFSHSAVVRSSSSCVVRRSRLSCMAGPPGS